MFVYLDNSATTKPYDSVVEIVTKTMKEDFGNPSSLYALGVDAEKILKRARSVVAESIGASTEEVFFTSGGTESDNTAVLGAWKSRKRQGNRILTTSVEHPAVMRACEYLQTQGAEVIYLPVHADGILDMDAFRAAFNKNTMLVSIMHVNNETGALMPLEDIKDEIEKTGFRPIFHTDAVQSYGKLETDVKHMGVDLLSLSGHKICGPKGVGALYRKKGLHLPPLIYGGGQEGGLRAGTENIPGIAGLAEAIGKQRKNQTQKKSQAEYIKAYFEELLKKNIPDIKINTPQKSSPFILNVSFLGCRGEVILHMLEQHEIYVSTGSACSSKNRGSHVLEAMGLSTEEIQSAVRFSFSSENTVEQMDYVMEKLKEAVEAQRRLVKFLKKDNI